MKTAKSQKRRKDTSKKLARKPKRIPVRRKRVPSYQDTVPEDEELIELSRLAPVDTRLDVPTTGLYGTHTQQRRYGTAKTVQALKAIGVSWAEKHHSPRIGIGDISKRGGGKISGHVSHRKGVDVDVRPVRNDNQELPVTYRDRGYSRELTQELIDFFHNNKVLSVKVIFFNDPQIHNVQPWPNHDNHFHVRFNMPETSVIASARE
jgi:hypothetical protein